MSEIIQNFIMSQHLAFLQFLVARMMPQGMVDLGRVCTQGINEVNESAAHWWWDLSGVTERSE